MAQHIGLSVWQSQGVVSISLTFFDNFQLNQPLGVILIHRVDIVLNGLLHRYKRLSAGSIFVTSAIEISTSKGIDIDIAS